MIRHSPDHFTIKIGLAYMSSSHFEFCYANSHKSSLSVTDCFLCVQNLQDYSQKRFRPLCLSQFIPWSDGGLEAFDYWSNDIYFMHQVLSEGSIRWVLNLDWSKLLYNLFVYCLSKSLGHSCGILDNKVGHLCTSNPVNVLLEPGPCWILVPCKIKLKT